MITYPEMEIVALTIEIILVAKLELIGVILNDNWPQVYKCAIVFLLTSLYCVLLNRMHLFSRDFVQLY